MLAVNVEPAALLATAPTTITIEALNETLSSYGLFLPIEPLQHGMTLADLVAHNAGGRRQVRYGTIASYLRAATIQLGNQPSQTLSVGGPTMKRATGYRLPQSLVGGAPTLRAVMQQQIDMTSVTMLLRPLPPARHAMVLACRSSADACMVADSVLRANLAPSALAVLDIPHRVDGAGISAPAGSVLLLVELEGLPHTLEQQTPALETLVEQCEAAVVARGEWQPGDDQKLAACWQPWEHATAQWANDQPVPDRFRPVSLDLTLPRAVLPNVLAQASAIAHRYHLAMPMWGDAGVGVLHLRLLPNGTADTPVTHAEAQQAAAIIATLAQHRDAPSPPRPFAESPPRPLAPPPLLAHLRDIVGPSYVLTRSEEVGGYAADASIARTSDDALAVVLPNSTEQVCRVLASAAAAGVPVVTRGAASGLAGGATASEGALIVSLNRMQRLHIDAHQRVARAEAGVVTADLQQAAEQHGLFYPPDPSSQTVSTIGGNIACNAGGPRCVKYGVTADYVLELTAVLADGRLVRVGDGITGQSPHTDLMHLLIGSEGTLALITEATLHLLPRPPARRTTVALFERLDDACATVEAIIAAGMLPAALELMDDTTIAVIDDYLHLGLPRDVEALLLLMADGSGEAVNDESELLANFARRGGARTVQVAGSARDEALLWRGRRAIGPALARVRPNRLSEDICVPVPQVAATVKRIKQVAAEYGLPIPVFGHAGDGNLHPNMLFDARDPAQVEQAWQAAEAVFRVALEMGGTLSGEHGIGILKRPFMPLALGADVLAMQQAIKAWFDPQGRLNPGKVLPPR